MRRIGFLTITTMLLLASASAWAQPRKGSGPAGPLTPAQVEAAVTGFVSAMDSLEEAKVLPTLTAGDRMALAGRENVLGLIYARRITNPQVKGVEPVQENGRVVGARVRVQVEETDPLDGTRVPRERTWVLALEGSELKISVTSLWLGLGREGRAP